MTDSDVFAFASAWRRFTAWLAVNSPADHASLRPAADAAQITSLEDRLGFVLHPQLRALLELHDGVVVQQFDDSREPFPVGSFLPLGYRLNTVERVLTDHRLFAELFAEEACGPELWDTAPLIAHARWWVPIARPNDGGLLFVDHCPRPTYGHVYEMGVGSGDIDGFLWATSLAELFMALTDSLDTGRPFRHFTAGTYRHSSGQHRIDWQVVL
ncbi:SMI1/KNR4 family protein [Kitasatospora sp. NRRL B-11411]|uniref:SMI1/KNR4 family protein n=1 Tax=Kitasatospora sp. NRRL B-11411 TaxID=1463822 RepID=UPI0004C37B12|nr:SMI1/KNR4 family protein [Kitasatospora sp. NRRL B-11411]